MKEFKTVKRPEINKLICDGCSLEASADDGYEFQEFISVKHLCGYGSIHGDGKQISIDLCQRCFADMCGDSLRVTDEYAISNSTEDNKSSESSRLEYSNIFDAICQSKDKALQLKSTSDIRLAARELLSKNTIDDKNELSLALKRVEQFWDVHYKSAEGNELHQLADLICIYEKKDWGSFFEQAPLADDDFMSNRLNSKSKFTFDEEQTTSGMLSGITINRKFDDEESRDSAIGDNNVEETNSPLLESIIRAQAKYPELRFGQLLISAMKLQEKCPEIFYIEDDDLAEKLNQLSS